MHEHDGEAAAALDVGSQRFKRLPERIRLEDTVETVSTNVARGSAGERETDRDLAIRAGG